jgi:hypothetical protein
MSSLQRVVAASRMRVSARSSRLASSALASSPAGGPPPECRPGGGLVDVGNEGAREEAGIKCRAPGRFSRHRRPDFGASAVPLDQRRVGHIDLIQALHANPLQENAQVVQAVRPPERLAIHLDTPTACLVGRGHDHATFGHATSLTRPALARIRKGPVCGW